MFESGSIHRIHGSVNRTHLVPCPIITWLSLRSKWAAGKARGGRISASIRNRRATQPTAKAMLLMGQDTSFSEETRRRYRRKIPLGLAAPSYRTLTERLAYGTFPGTSCQATFSKSLRDRPQSAAPNAKR